MSGKSTLVFITLAAFAGPLLAHGSVRFVNGRWLEGDDFVARTMYSVDGVLRSEPPATVDRTLDLGGGWVVPPLADAHSHGLADPGFDKESRRFLAQGIFYVQNPNSVRSWSEAAREKAASPETVDVTYAMGGLTSSGGHPIQIYDRLAAHLDGWTPERMRGEAYFVVDTAADLDAVWPQVLAGRPDFVKTYLEHSEEHAARHGDDAFYGRRGLDPALLPRVVERAHASGLRVSTHVTTAADFRVAVAAGVDEIAHLPLAPLAADDARAAAAAGVVVVTTTLSHRPTDGVADVDALHRANLALLVEHGVRLVLGTDSDRSVLDEAENLVRLGMDPGKVLHLLTGETARWIFPDREIGRLTPGAEASFLVVSGDPRADLRVLREPVLRVKQGHVLDVSAAEGRPEVSQRLAHLLMRDGIEAAVAEYQRLLAEEPEAWDFSEPQLNALGYFALEHGRAADAVVFFRLNTERFPGSANVWDSLGDGLAAAGDTAAARASYARALEINPGAGQTREKLEALDRP